MLTRSLVSCLLSVCALFLACRECEASGAESVRSCEERIAAFEQWTKAMLADLDRGLHSYIDLRGRKALRLALEAPEVEAEPAPLVSVLKTHIEVLGKPVAVDSVRERRVVGQRLGELAEQYRAIHGELRPFPGRVNLLAEAGAPWSLVVEAVAGARAAGYDKVSLLFLPRRARQAAKPTPSAAHQELQRILDSVPISGKAEAMAALISKTIVGCPDLVAVFDELSRSGRTGKPRMLLEGSPAAIRACGCKLDIAAYQEILASMMVVDEPVVAVAFTAAGPDRADAAELELPADTPWRDAHAKLIARIASAEGKPLALAY